MTADTIWARSDDHRAGRSLMFPRASELLVAQTPDEVVEVLAAAHTASRAGRWLFGFVTYEAGLVLHGLEVPARVDGMPLVWFGVTDGTPTRATPLPASSPGSARVGPWACEWTRAEHARRVAAVRELIASGDTYQVNLTTRFTADVTGDPLDLYARVSGRQNGSYAMYIDTGRVAVLSASPELFVEVTEDHATMRPMKGTRPRGRDIDEDARIVHELRTSEKDRAENIMIVDLVRNDLARIASGGSVRVRSLCQPERYDTVHQLTSEVTADLEPGTDLVDVFRALFPSGSVTGAPKHRAMQIITELETSPRGVYCGAVGYLAPPTEHVRARFNVAIRTIVVDRVSGTATYGSGGGITWTSDADDEYDELLAKAAVLTESPTDFDLLETMRSTQDGAVHLLDRHLGRLGASAQYFGFVHDGDSVRRQLQTAGRDHPARRLRLTLSRDGSCTIEAGPLPSPVTRRVRLAVDDRPVDPADPFLRHKTTARARYDIARARHPDADDTILVNRHGRVTEACTSSLLVKIDGIWWTPPVADGCLPGTQRAECLERGRAKERSITLADLTRAEDVAVLNALRGWRTATVVC